MMAKHQLHRKLGLIILIIIVLSLVTDKWVLAQQTKEVKVGALLTLSRGPSSSREEP